MKRYFTLLMTGWLFLWSGVGLGAPPSGLDPAFGQGKGWVQLGFHTTPSCDGISKVLELPDGKLLVAGGTSNCANGDDVNSSALWRFHPDGSIDTTFNHNGILFKPTDGFIRDMLQQPDGKIVLADPFGQLVRLLPDGQPDPAFHLCDAFVKSLPSAATMRYHTKAARVIQQQDGKLVTLATIIEQAQLTRFNTDGSCDTGFNITGRTLFADKTQSINQIVQQTDGKLIATGINGLGNPVRFNTDGSIDTTFKPDNAEQNRNGNDKDRRITLPDNRFLLASEKQSRYDTGIYLSRFQPDGQLDTHFGHKGTAMVTSDTSSESLRDMILLRDGSTLLATAPQQQHNSVIDKRIAMHRLLPDGKPDDHFGQNGVMRFNTGLYTGASQIETDDDQATAGLIQQDGKIVLAGTSSITERDADNNDEKRGRLAIARFLPDGKPDIGFNKIGAQTTVIPKTVQTKTILQQTDGKLLAVGESLDTLSTLSIVRYNTDGTLDTQYGENGILSLPTSQNPVHVNTATLLPDNTVLVAGSTNGNNQDVLLMRFSSTGALDTAFGQQGKILVDVGTYSVDQPAALLTATDGSFLVAGTTHDGSSNDWFVLHYSANGTLDTTFDNTGKQIIDFGEQGDDMATGLLRQPDGKILILGSSQTGTKRPRNPYSNAISGKADSLMALARLHADGTLDSSFNQQGWARYRTGTLTSDEGIAMQLQADGKILITGRYQILPWGEQRLSDWKTALMRIQPDGTLDSTFHNKGKINWSLRDNANTEPATLLRSADGHVYIGGTVHGRYSSSFYLLQAEGAF